MTVFERLDDINRWLLTALCTLLPFFFLPNAWMAPVQAKALLMACMLIIAAILWIVARFSEGTLRMPWNLAVFLAGLVPLTYALSSVITGRASVSLVGSGTESDTLALVCVFFAAFTLTASLFAMHPRRIVYLIRGVLLGAAIALLVEIIHFVFPSLALGGALSGQTGNLVGGWHDLAILAGLGFFFAPAFIETPVGARLWRTALFALALFSLIILVIANYLDVWLAVIAALAALLLIRGYRASGFSDGAFWRMQYLPLASIIIAAFFAIFGAFIVNVLPQSVRVAQSDVRPSWQGTLAIGEQTLSRPVALLFGSGPNTFTREWGLHKPVDVNQTQFWNIDFSTGVASIPTAFITVGLLGLLAWLAFIAGAIFVCARFWFSHTDAPVALLALPLSLGSLYLLSFQILSIPGTPLVLLFFVLFGCTLALLSPTFSPLKNFTLGKGSWQSWALLLGTSLGALALVIGAGAAARATYAEALVNKAIVTYNATQKTDAPSAIIAQALKVYPRDDRAHRAAVELGLISLQNLIANAGSDDAAKAQLQAALKETIQHGLDAVALNGADYQNWLSLASLYAQLAGSNIPGAYDNAHAAFQKALAENPTSPVPYVNLAQLELLQNHPDVALQDLANAIRLKSDYASAYYLASQIYAAQNDMQNALQAAAAAAQYDSSDSQAWYNLGIIAYAAKDYADAAAALKQALVIEPQYANAMYVLGLTYYQQHDTQNALATFQALDKLDSSQPVVKEIIADLEAGKPIPQAQESQPKK
ncbi:MAG: tetratricopeptide repeat protein [Candidatus Kaiserbacteria bacterium]|nr:tetratricopeptide repeat protein [Candidatus Kaiserbacteria bacterium]